jgi:hypothetical protein
MSGFLNYNPLDPFDGPTASADPPPAYQHYENVQLDIQNPAFPGSSVYRPSKEASEHDEKLIITGQGTVAVLAPPVGFMLIRVGISSSLLSKGVALLVTPDSCEIWGVDDQGGLHKFNPALITEKKDKANWYMKNYTANYWLSFDLSHGRIRYGIGLFSVQLALFEINLKTYDSSAKEWKWDNGWDWLQDLKYIKVLTGDKSQLAITPLPIVNDVPPLIRSGDQVSLLDLAEGKFTVPENTPAACQKLYHNVAGVDIALDTPDFPDFSSAIEYSVNTPGAYGYELLQAKIGELSPDPLGTYLRITLVPIWATLQEFRMFLKSGQLVTSPQSIIMLKPMQSSR